MTQICAMCKSLLRGEVLSIMNGFHWFSCTNVPREMGRSIDRKFGVKVDRKLVHFVSKHGQKGTFKQYRLLHTPENKEGIAKMRAYIKEIEQQDYKNQPAKKGPKIVNVKQSGYGSARQELFQK